MVPVTTTTALPARVDRFRTYAESHGYEVTVETDRWIHVIEGRRQIGEFAETFHAMFSAKAGGFLGLTMFPALGRMKKTKKLSDARILVYVHGNFEGRDAL